MNYEKQTINFLLHAAAMKLLAGSAKRGPVQRDAEHAYNRIRAQHEPETIKGVDMIAGILSSLCGQLTRCQSIEQLERAVQYVEALEKGEVLLATDEP